MRPRARGGGPLCTIRVSGSLRLLVPGRWAHSTRGGSQSLTLGLLVLGHAPGCSHSRALPDAPARRPWDTLSLAHSDPGPLTLPPFVLTNSFRQGGLTHAGVFTRTRAFSLMLETLGRALTLTRAGVSHVHPNGSTLTPEGIVTHTPDVITLPEVFTTPPLKEDDTDRHRHSH